MKRVIPGRLDAQALALLTGPKRPATSELLALLDRARHDIERGWNAAAQDCLVRALELLRGKP